MATLRDIVQQGLRESGIIPVGSQPDAEIFEETLDRLKGLIGRIFGDELGEFLADISDECIDCIPANSRVISDSTKVLKLPKNPADGCRVAITPVADTSITLDGNGRKASFGAITSNREFFYRADLGEWKEVTELTPDSESPFPSIYDDYLSLLLAMRVNYRYGMETDLTSFQKMQRRFKAQYKQSKNVNPEEALVRLSSSRYSWGRFNTGEI